MRIIAGEHRGRVLLAPEGDATRPITDRAKQSLFDIVTPLIAGARVYDCFAGTGSMGLECLSRSAAHVTFFERDRSALARLRKNIESLRATERATVVAQDIFRYFDSSRVAANTALVFLDPPYRFLTERPDALTRLAAALTTSHLSPGAIVVFRHDSRDRLEMPPLTSYDQREYGGMTIEFLRAATQ
jgi:16S rRNA (guanine966-N2)-methyltransferase